MKLFGLRILSESDYQELKHGADANYRLSTYMHWFSGWPHVYDLLRRFSQGNIGTTNVSTVRYSFAADMGTDEYGKESQ